MSSFSGGDMTPLSLSAAWNETTAFVRREARLLFPIAFLLIALPVAAAAAMAPQPGPGQLPRLGAWAALLAAAMLVGMIGQVAIAFLALRPGASVGEALARGGRRFLPLLGAYLIVGVACAAVIIVFAVLASLIVPGAAATPPNPRTAGLYFALLVLLMLPLFLFVWTRTMLSNAIAAAENGGSIAILQRSWRLTGPYFWPLLGFVVLSAVLAAVVSFAAQAVLGIPVLALAGQPRPGSLSAVLILLIGAAINTVVTVFLTTMIARLYAQLVPDSKAEVFA
jgi:hypothetical protein